MKPFDSPKEAEDFMKQALRDSEPERSELARYQAHTRLYYMGIQWASQRRGQSGRVLERIDRQFPNYNAEQGPIRAVMNRVTRNIIQVSSATNPEDLEVDALASGYQTSSDKRNVAFAAESFANALIRDCGMIEVARRANFERTVCGIHGMGICQEIVGDDVRLKSFDFDAARLTLDPGVSSTDLTDHDYVMYSEVVTIHKLKRMLGSEYVENTFDESKMPTMGALMPIEIEFAQLSGGSLYRRYAEHSATKAARVNWLYMKDESGRFGKMYLSVDAGNRVPVIVNMENPINPYGGNGLPLVLIKGHERPGTRLPVSDVGMMIGDQDRLNLLATLFLQQAYEHVGGFQWLADKRWFGSNRDAEGIAEMLGRRVVLTDGPAPNSSAPSMVRPPEPSMALDQMMRGAADDVRNQGFRSEAVEGKLKSHVTNDNFQATMEMSNLPLDDRIRSDVRQYERLIDCAVSTGVMMLAMGSRYMARTAVNAGLSDYELGVLTTVDPMKFPVKLSLKSPSLRKRSRVQRRQDVLDAVGVQAIAPDEMRFIMAMELDTPLSEGDKRAAKYAAQRAVQVRDGEEYVPLSLGPYSEYVIRALRWLLMEDRTSQIPGALARIEQAIVDQMQHDAEQMQRMQAMMAGPEEEQPDPSMESMSIEDMLGGQALMPEAR